MKKKNTPKSSAIRPLAQSVRAALTLYRSRIRSILIATFIPLALIVALRWLSDDYTGDQYGLVIGLISIFNTMLLARLVTVGWHSKEVKLLPYYNGVMSRYLSGVGLVSLLGLHVLPLLAGILLLGLVATGQFALVWLALIIPLCLIGLGIAIYASLAIFAMMDDMSLSVIQSLRVSGRLTRQYYRQLISRTAGMVVVFIIIGALLVLLGTWLAPLVQSTQVQLFIDAGLSWILTPALFCYGATVYRMLLEAYE